MLRGEGAEGAATTPAADIWALGPCSTSCSRGARRRRTTTAWAGSWTRRASGGCGGGALELKDVLRSMLHPEPECRPTAEELMVCTEELQLDEEGKGEGEGWWGWGGEEGRRGRGVWKGEEEGDGEGQAGCGACPETLARPSENTIQGAGPHKAGQRRVRASGGTCVLSDGKGRGGGYGGIIWDGDWPEEESASCGIYGRSSAGDLGSLDAEEEWGLGVLFLEEPPVGGEGGWEGKARGTDKGESWGQGQGEAQEVRRAGDCHEAHQQQEKQEGAGGTPWVPSAYTQQFHYSSTLPAETEHQGPASHWTKQYSNHSSSSSHSSPTYSWQQSPASALFGALLLAWFLLGLLWLRAIFKVLAIAASPLCDPFEWGRAADPSTPQKQRQQGEPRTAHRGQATAAVVHPGATVFCLQQEVPTAHREVHWSWRALGLPN